MHQHFTYFLVIPSLGLNACTTQATATESPTLTPEPPTTTASVEPPTVTFTPAPADTSTLQPTSTATSVPSNTPEPTATATASRTPLPPPTLTFTPSPRAEAPVFSQTIMHPYTSDDFRKELAELVNFNQQFVSSPQYLVNNGSTGSCNYFYNYRNEHIVSQAGYFDVPEVAYPIYYQYRLLVHEAVAAVQPITGVCDAGGGTITLEQDLAIIATLTNVIGRAQQLQAEAAALP